MTKIGFKMVAALLLSTVLLWGCGSSGGDSPQRAPQVGDFGVDADGISRMGAGMCLACHSVLTIGELDPELAFAYLRSRHAQGNLNAGSNPTCLGCHDPIRDGRTIEAFLPADFVIPANGVAAVGCENCHGAGGDHVASSGEVLVPRAMPGAQTCGTCHDALAPPGPHAGASQNIFSNYMGSAHAESHLSFPTIVDSSFCSRCHTDEGFREHAQGSFGLDFNQLLDYFTVGGFPAPANAGPVQCRTCHEPHAAELRATETLVDERVAFSREFNLCTSCHQFFLTATFNEVTGNFNYAIDAEKLVGHGSLPSQNLHLALFNVNNFRPSDRSICTQCHNPHTTDFVSAAAASGFVLP